MFDWNGFDAVHIGFNWKYLWLKKRDGEFERCERFQKDHLWLSKLCVELLIARDIICFRYAGVMTSAKEDEVFSENNWYSFDIMSVSAIHALTVETFAVNYWSTFVEFKWIAVWISRIVRTPESTYELKDLFFEQMDPRIRNRDLFPVRAPSFRTTWAISVLTVLVEESFPAYLVVEYATDYGCQEKKFLSHREERYAPRVFSELSISFAWQALASAAFSVYSSKLTIL